MFWQGPAFCNLMSKVLVQSSLSRSSSLAILASCKASWFEDRGVYYPSSTHLDPLYKCISLDRYVGRASCQTTQQYSGTERTRSPVDTNKTTSNDATALRRTRIICRHLDALDTVIQMCSVISDCPG